MSVKIKDTAVQTAENFEKDIKTATEKLFILNTIISAPISNTIVHQPHLNENVSGRIKKQFFMDCDGMNDELIKYVMAYRGQI